MYKVHTQEKYLLKVLKKMICTMFTGKNAKIYFQLLKCLKGVCNSILENFSFRIKYEKFDSN